MKHWGAQCATGRPAPTPPSCVAKPPATTNTRAPHVNAPHVATAARPHQHHLPPAVVPAPLVEPYSSGNSQQLTMVQPARGRAPRADRNSSRGPHPWDVSAAAAAAAAVDAAPPPEGGPVRERPARLASFSIGVASDLSGSGTEDEAPAAAQQRTPRTSATPQHELGHSAGSSSSSSSSAAVRRLGALRQRRQQRQRVGAAAAHGPAAQSPDTAMHASTGKASTHAHLGGGGSSSSSSSMGIRKVQHAPPGTRQASRRLVVPAVATVLCVMVLLAATSSVSSVRSVLQAATPGAKSGSGAASAHAAQAVAAAAAGGGGGSLLWGPSPHSHQGSSIRPRGFAAAAPASWLRGARAWRDIRTAAVPAASSTASSLRTPPTAAGGALHSSTGAGGAQGSSRRTAPAATSSGAGGAAGALQPGGSATPSSSGGGGSGSQALAGDTIRMYAIVDTGAPSPFKAHSPQRAGGPDWSSTWGDVLQHMARRLAWTDERFDLQVLSQQQLRDNPAVRDSLRKALSSSGSSGSSPPMFFGIAVTDPDVAAFLGEATAQLPTALFWDSAPQLGASSRVDGYAPRAAGPLAQALAKYVGFSREAKAASVLTTLDVLWQRHTSDDLLYIWLVLLNQYVTPVPMVADSTKGTDLPSLICMIKNCGQKIVDCVTDKTCKAGLDCLEGCPFNDQTCQYRCIVSYETPRFEQFALCILQLHNCRGLNAQAPAQPDPAPMATWRGAPLTHEAAEDLFIGWMAAGPQLPAPDAPLKPYSWLVAAGKNPAYDAFGCQHQLYTRGRGRGQLWYEPVFKVTTLDGQEVWRRRRYRVRRGTTPGTFHYSVLDNGVTSNEYWRIIDCAEDLSFCLFYYSGAAATAGLSYSGAVLGTPDGLWPADHTQRIHGALRQAGIEPWELSIVDNSACGGAPLTAAA